MSSLVSDLLINPVLRQARRFSRSGNSSENVDSVTNQRPPHENTSTGTAASRVSESHLEDGGVPLTSVSGQPLVSSPTQENDESEVGLATGQEGRSRSTSDNARQSSAVPLRLASIRSERSSFDGDVSDNPSFGLQGRFQTASPRSASLNLGPSATTNPAEASPGRTTQDLTNSAISGNNANHQRNSSLPADDGMGELRKKIVQIQGMEVGSEIKALMMHQVLTQEYNQSQTNLHAKNPRSHSPASMVSQERPSTPGSLSSFTFWHATETSPESSPPSSNPRFQLSSDDLKPTFAPLSSPKEDFEDSEDLRANSTEMDFQESEPVPQLGCQHYKRKVKLQCFTCSRWYTCRFCHDEVEDHSLNRRETKNMLCMLCGYAQRAGEACFNCGVRSAWYYCNVCHLWDDDASKSIYHCDDCGICRVGRGLGKDYMHCKTCGVCILISKEHKCVERASDCDCPICGEYLFNSPQTVVFMKCGHTIHQTCYKDLMKTSYKCPLCSQSVVNMETQFRNLDRAIESQPMPPQFQDTQALVSCNDCYAKSLVKYHWLGLKCAVCDSYNTAQLQIITSPVSEPGPNESDIIPGPRADIFIPDLQRAVPMQLEQPERPEPEHRPTRRRRHSSLALYLSSTAHSSSSRFSPYPLPQRIGRSVSPMLSSQVLDDFRTSNVTITDAVESEDEEEDDLDFWGRDMRRSPRIETINADEQDEESEDDSWSEMDDEEEDEEEDDEVDAMDLIGHR